MNGVVAEGLVKRFGDFTALKGVDFAVPEATLVGLLGPNGAGKTTTIRILTTLLQPDDGHATVAGFDVVRQPQLVRSVIGLTGQFAAIDEDLTGRENLVLVGPARPDAQGAAARERAAELLDTFGLVDAADRPLRTYSGGMRRRADVAARLMVAPAVLFLDEPTTGLDPRSRLGLWDVIMELKQAGTTIVLTTQYLEEADQLCDRISVIDVGQIIVEGTADELKTMVGGDVLDLDVSDRAYVDQAVTALAQTFAIAESDVDDRPGARAASRACRDRRRRADRGRALTRRRRRTDRRPRRAATVARRRVPQPDRSCRRGAAYRGARAGRPASRPDGLRGLVATITRTTRHPDRRAARRAPAGPGPHATSGSIAGRNLRKTLRNTGLIVFSTLQPLMQLVLFVEVFGAVVGLKAASPTRTSSCPPCSCRRWCSRRWARASASPTICRPA